MKINKDMITHSEEVQEIIGKPPKFIIRSGISILFILFIIGIGFTYFFKYPSIIEVPFILTNHNPNIPVTTEEPGSIKTWFVEESQEVKKNQIIAVLKSGNKNDIDPNTMTNLEYAKKKEYHLKCPIDGTIRLTKSQYQESQVSKSEIVAYVIPDRKNLLTAEADIPSSEIRKVKTGQKVNLKLSAFPYLEYGSIHGRIISISGVPLEIPEGPGLYYPAEIQIISIPKEEYSEELRYFEKMDGIAEIILEESRLITRLFHNADQIFNKNK